MISNNIFNCLMSGQLVGDTIKNTMKTSLRVIRYPTLNNGKKNNRYNLIHTTDALLEDVLIGHAQTYIKGDLDKWNDFKDIRMNVLLNKFGYKIVFSEFDYSNQSINRVILSEMCFGEVKICEQIFVKNL